MWDAGASQLGSGVDRSDRSMLSGTTGWVATVKSEYSIPQSEDFLFSGARFIPIFIYGTIAQRCRAHDWILRVIKEKEKEYQK